MAESRRPQVEELLRMTREGTSVLWLRLRKWFFIATGVGIAVGLLTAAIDYVALELLWGRFERLSPVAIVLLPTLGLFLSGLALHYTKRPDIHGTDEYIEAFHKRGGVHDYRSFPLKLAAAISTVGLGGSAGLEAPSIYAGGVVGSWLVSRLERFGFSRGDVRDLMVAGSAAGISAIFKTPLTGIIFALEVPYTDDLVREALIPSLVASISSYIVFVTLIGVEPLFLVTERFTLSLRDLAYTLALGLIIGLGARAYVASFHWIRSRALKMRTPIFVRTAAGGFVCGLIGLLSWRVFGSPVALGVGYETIIAGVAGHYSAAEAAWILLLKGSATLATLASGGAGGIFIPMIMLGVMSGGLLKALLPAVVSEGSLFPVVGMAAFLAAGYRAPIAAAVFVAESTGGAGYLIPGLVAAAVAYTVAGRRSISSAQRWRRETTLDRLLRLKVDDIMTKEVAPVPVHTDLLDFMQNYVVKLHHTSFPVTDEGRLVGMIALSDLDSVPFAEWSQCPVSSVMVRRYVSTTPDETVGRLLAMMAEKDVDVVPVVDRCESQCLVGVVSSADVIALDEVSADWVEKQRLARRTGATLS